MDSAELKLFEDFNNKIKNVKLYSKAIDIYNEYITKSNNSTTHKLMKSVIDENRYKKALSKEEFFSLIDRINKFTFRDECTDIMNNIFSYTGDDAQINTIKRIINLKSMKPDLVPLCNLRMIPKKETIVTKPCPHCGMVKTESSEMTYVICGYGTKGFDWKGCGFDWCFSCGKKLCKCWNVNLLYNTKNRFHNNKCCKSHSLKTGGVYPDDYCQCRNKNVVR